MNTDLLCDICSFRVATRKWACGCPGVYCDQCIPRHRCRARYAQIGDRANQSWIETLHIYELQLARFRAIVAENESVLFMPQEINYPINRKMLSRWINEQSTENLRHLAATVAMSLVHVSFGDFMARLLNVSKWVQNAIDTIKNENLTKRVIPLLFMPGEDNFFKSNSWTTMLVLGTGAITDICGLIFNTTDAYTLQRQASAEGSKIRVVVMTFDDASFTGRQMATNLTPVISVVGREGLANPDVIFLVGVGYIGENGIRTITSGAEGDRLMNMKFPPTPISVVVQKAKTFLEPALKLLDPDELKVVKNRFGYHEMCSTMYFDHKMPDMISTMTLTLSFGEVIQKEPDADGSYQWFSDRNFISGCMQFPQRFPIPTTAMSIDARTRKLMSSDESCPPAFYKSIPYTQDGKPISHDVSTEDLLRVD